MSDHFKWNVILAMTSWPSYIFLDLRHIWFRKKYSGGLQTRKESESFSVAKITDELNIFQFVFRLRLYLVLPSTEYLLKTGLVHGHFTLLKQYGAIEFEGPAYDSLHSPLLQPWGWRIAVTPVLTHTHTHTHKEKCMLKTNQAGGKKGKSTKSKEYTVKKCSVKKR